MAETRTLQAVTVSAMTSRAQDEFRELLERHRGIVLKVASTYARTAEDRADLAQEVAVQLWRAFPRFDPQRPFSTWMYRVALNVGISFLRSRGARAQEVPLEPEHESRALAGGETPEDAERVRGLERAIARLDAMNRALLMLYLEDRSYAEIGEVLGISETNVGTKLARLRQRMRAELTKEDEE
jgi:RNA polymerase sigma factor (sigma-70 family)